MRRAPAVVVVPVAPDGRVWLAHMPRSPAKISSWELPGGAIDEGETPISAGLREMEEELGLVAGKARVIGPPLEFAPGMGTFPHHVVLASSAVPRDRVAVG